MSADGQRATRKPSNVVLRSAALALGVLASSCSSVPSGFLLPTHQVPPEARLVDMLVITTRQPTPEPGVVFSGERDRSSSIVQVVVSVPPTGQRIPGRVQWPSRRPPDPSREFTTVSIKPSDPDQTEAWFEREAGPRRRMLIFVHGYNTRFETAVYRFAQIAVDSGAEAAPVLFTWPSRGRLLDYKYDRDSAIFSRDSLERLLLTAAHGDRVQDITVLAHSMGTYLAMESLRQVAIREGQIPAKIRNVVLASPDIDPYIFARQHDAFGVFKPHVTIFVARNDRALAISRIISGRIGRLGAMDPSREPYRSHLESLGNVTVIDLSEVHSGDRLNHARFADSPEVVKLIGQRLVNGQEFTDVP
jgi:esterase/lipase superfamily enzyme